MSAVEFRLYINGGSPGASRIIDVVRQLLATRCPAQHQLDIFDLGKEPSAGLRDRVLAVPTLLRASPAPQRRVVGDLSDADAVWSAIAD
jgi:circadian clock protein KaiB